MSEGIFGFKEEYRWMSNFQPVPEFEFEGRRWWTIEHAYQASKTLDQSEKAAIWRAPTPGKAKRLGQQAHLREDWFGVRYGVMLALQRLKYQNIEFAEVLRATGDKHIEETNNWGDTFWGVCKGVGENKMGIILMCVREELNAPLV